MNPGGKDPSQFAINSVLTHNWSNGYYLQDTWTIANVLTLGFGVRLDTQVMTNASPENPPWTPQLDIRNSWAPRVQAIWDFTGQGRGKVQGNWGRYYESVPLVIAFAALATSPAVTGGFEMSTCSDAMIPGPSSQGNPSVSCPNVYGLPVGSGPGPNTRDLGPSPLSGSGFSEVSAYFAPVAPGIQGQYTDQFGGGVQYEVLQDLSVGVDYLGRRQGTVIEDMSSTEGTSFFIANPGASQPWTPTDGPYAGTTFNPRNAASLDRNTGNVYTAAFPTPVRSYDAVTVSVNKLFSEALARAGELHLVVAARELLGPHPHRRGHCRPQPADRIRPDLDDGESHRTAGGEPDEPDQGGGLVPPVPGRGRIAHAGIPALRDLRGPRERVGRAPVLWRPRRLSSSPVAWPATFPGRCRSTSAPRSPGPSPARTRSTSP